MLGHDGELLDSHLFFFDKYSGLADYHRQQGRIVRADRLAAIAEAYFQAAPDDDEPPEAADARLPFTDEDVNALRRARMTVGEDIGCVMCSLPSPAELPSVLRHFLFCLQAIR